LFQPLSLIWKAVPALPAIGPYRDGRMGTRDLAERNVYARTYVLVRRSPAEMSVS
jgi:hypothetical protein